METTRRNLKEQIITALIKAAGYSAIVFVVLIFFFLLKEGLPTLNEVSFSNLFSTRWYPIEDYFGLIPLISGSLIVTIGATAIAVPFGIGGAMLTDNDAIAEAVDLHRRPHTPKWINHGYNSQINEVDAAIVWWKLENRFDAWQQRRTEIANYYIDNLNVECVVPHSNSTSAWHKFVIKHDNRDTLKLSLQEFGIETKVHYAKTLDGEQNDFTRRCLSLPIYPELTDSEVEHIVKSTNTALELLS